MDAKPVISVVLMIQQRDRLIPQARTVDVKAASTVARAVLAELDDKIQFCDDPTMRDPYILEAKRVRATLTTLGIHVEAVVA
jgi:hypothetical protein